MMKISLLMGTCVLSLSTVGAQTECPATPDSPDVSVGAGKIDLVRSHSETLCTLTKVIAGRTLIPVARSYLTRDWEASAGAFASEISPSCTTDHCTFNLPTVGQDEEYLLTTLAGPEYTHEEKVARFLEQASFGVTREELNKEHWSSTTQVDQSIPTWIDDQINNVPMTSHREYFRKRTNAPSELSYYYGKPGPKPCDNESRWRRFSFSIKDSTKSFRYEEYSLNGSNSYIIYIDNIARTIVPLSYNLSLTNEPGRSHAVPSLQLDTTYSLCLNTWWGVPILEEKIGGQVGININNNCFLLAGGNPEVNIDPSNDALFPHQINLPALEETSQIISIDDQVYTSDFFPGYASADQYMVLDGSTLDANECSTLPNPWDLDNSEGFPINPIFAKTSGSWLQYDPRHLGRKNTPLDPLLDGGGRYAAAEGAEGHLQSTSGSPYDNIFCANAPRTFQNEDTCRLSADTYACHAQTSPKFSVKLDDPGITSIHNLTQRWVFAIKDLPMPSATNGADGNVHKPCRFPGNVRVRFLRVDDFTSCESNANVQQGTVNVFANLLREGGNELQATAMPMVKTVLKSWSVGCADADVDVWDLGYIPSVNTCWKHVHLDDHNVYDFTTSTGNPTPAFGDVLRDFDGQPKFPFPNDSTFLNWEANKIDFTLIGTYGDNVGYESLPGVLQTSEVASELGYVSVNPTGDGVVVCGSPGEVASEPRLGSGYDYNKFWRSSTGVGWSAGETTPVNWHVAQKTTIWTNIALTAEDQLRQRVAWALSQILVIAPDILSDQRNTETTISFYDIFVRNAFGNYFQVLKEVAFHEKMGEMLSFIGSKSFQYNMDFYSLSSFPDENFAREFLQLFTIGLHELNMDGTPKVDASGNVIPTYETSDILSFARAWTGFQAQARRGNVEARTSSTDPMFIEADYRDPFPKSNLYGGFIGDGIELCVDQPEKQFLRRGASYRLLGARDLPEWQEDRADWSGKASIKKFNVTNGNLYNKLCAASSGQCTFPGKVTLDTNLLCTDLECEVDTVRIVRVKDPPNPIYYEYIRPPCVEHAFFNSALRVKDWVRHPDFHVYNFMCADPRRDVAVEACCVSETDRWGLKNCVYNGERMKYSTALTRCQENGRIVCDFLRFRLWQAGICAEGADQREWRKDTELYEFFHWTDTTCKLQVKINQEGHTAIVHNPGAYTLSSSSVRSLVAEDSENYFKVSWDNNQYPRIDNVPGECKAVANDLLCNVEVIEEAVFSGSNLPSRADILLHLRIGAVNPDAFDNSVYTLVSSTGGVDVLKKSGEDTLGVNTIFKVTDDNGVEKLLKNMKSTVRITNESYNFRNPVHFISLVDPETRDAYHETEEIIKHVFYHPNTAPFVSRNLIQRFGISNPSPRYLSTVANAFKTGSFIENGTEFGSKKYGDLAATIAAILLDPEARSTVLDADPAHGSLREPLLKVVGFMRSMEYIRDSPEAVPLLDGLNEKIGQGAHEVKSVFSFFLPEYSPSGTIGAGGLVSPEAQVLGTSKTISIVEGLFRLVKYGLSGCTEGFNNIYMGPGTCGRNAGSEGNNLMNFGHISFSSSNGSSAEDVVNELSLLLTSGRLSRENRLIVESAYAEANINGNKEKALRVAQQLIAATAEFHSTDVVQKNQQTLAPPPAPEPISLESSYKAVVYLFLNGGADTYNVLVPDTSCVTYNEYESIRGSLALGSNKLSTIDATGSNQICTKFAINSVMQNLYKSYETDSDALFFANTGVLQKIVTKETWLQETKTPLFSHNSQQRETHKTDLANLSGETGVVGRMMDVLRRNGVSTGLTTIDQGSLALTGSPTENNGVSEVHSRYNSLFNQNPSYTSMIDDLNYLHNATSRNSGRFFADTWSSRFTQAIVQNEEIVGYFNDASYNPATNFDGDSAGTRLKAVARMIKAREARNVQRDAFFVEIQGFDFHSSTVGDSTFENLIGTVDKALGSFKTEMESLSLWNNVVVISLSDFGRTLTPNSGSGSDHAWGGNYFMMGGSVRGKRILGEYPAALSADAPLNIGRGRIIPTTPWEAVWNGISQWMGVTDDSSLDEVLPNRNNFEKCSLFFDKELFVDGTVDKSTCLIPVTPSPTNLPTTASPTTTPTSNPTPVPTIEPTSAPTPAPTPVPTTEPTSTPTPVPTPAPTTASLTTTPTSNPTPVPTIEPTSAPTPAPTPVPTTEPTSTPTPVPTPVPTTEPTSTSTPVPTPVPTTEPTSTPTPVPTPVPTTEPTSTSTPVPTPAPTTEPTSTPTHVPTPAPTTASLTTTPTSNPTPVPTIEPTSAPTPVPTKTPETPSPTKSPTISVPTSPILPSDGKIGHYDIFPLGEGKVVFDDEHSSQEIEFAFNVSKKEIGLEFYEADCVTPVDNTVISGLFEKSEAPTSEYMNTTIKIDAKPENVQGDQNILSIDADRNIATLSFCFRLDLYATNAKLTSVNFLETVVTIFINMENGFTVDSVSTDRDVATREDEDVKAAYSLESYQCNSIGERNTTPLSQGDPLNLCLETSSTTVIINRVLLLSLVQQGEGGGSLTPISPTTGMDGLTSVEKMDGGKKLIIQTMLRSSFFTRANSNDVNITGRVLFEFDANGVGRHLGGLIGDNDDDKRDGSYLISPSTAVLAKDEEGRSVQVLPDDNSQAQMVDFYSTFSVISEHPDDSSKKIDSEDTSNRNMVMILSSAFFGVLVLIGVALQRIVSKKHRRHGEDERMDLISDESHSRNFASIPRAKRRMDSINDEFLTA